MMTKEKETYNGWSNYETWAVNLWLTNDEGSYHWLTEIVRKAASGEVKDYAAAEMLKEWVEGNAPDLGASVYSDLLTSALGEVDWLEIVENNKDD